MGFWSTLVHTASSIGGFVVNNAGSIAKVLRVAAKFEDDDSEDLSDAGDGNAARTLFTGFNNAESAMMIEAKKLFPRPTQESGMVKGPYSILGL